jgi:hypothetical protein
VKLERLILKAQHSVTMCDDCTDVSRPLFYGVHVWVLDACARGLVIGLAATYIIGYL